MDELIKMVKQVINTDFQEKENELKNAAALLTDCITNNGVIQMIGANEYEEFTAELYYRSGGLVPFHKMTTTDLVLNGLANSDSIYYNDKYLQPLLDLYQIEDNDMFMIVSEKGEEKLLIALAKNAKQENKKIIAVLVEESTNGIAKYADSIIHIHKMNEAALIINGNAVAQINATLNDTIAQMLSFETFSQLEKKGACIDIFLSNNNPNALDNNRRVIEKYKGRVHL